MLQVTAWQGNSALQGFGVCSIYCNKARISPLLFLKDKE